MEIHFSVTNNWSLSSHIFTWILYELDQYPGHINPVPYISIAWLSVLHIRAPLSMNPLNISLRSDQAT